MKVLIPLLLLAVATYGEQFDGILDAIPSDAVSGLEEKDAKSLKPEVYDGGTLKKFAEPSKSFMKPMSLAPPVGPGAVKALKAAVLAPVKKVVVKKAVAGKLLAAPKLKASVALKKKPKVYSLKPIVHVIEKRVPVYHKVPVPKKVMVPKFYPVMKPIPFPKIIPVPYKVPVKKIIPKIVKIPKGIPIPKFVKVKKPFPVPIPYPVMKFHKVPVPKLVPYAKYIPIPIPKKVPKFIPVPVKKIIKVPKPYYVPIKVPHITYSYVKSPKVVNVPDIKKFPSGVKKYPFGGKMGFESPVTNLKSGSKDEAKFLESLLGNTGNEASMFESLAGLGDEDKELLKLLSEGMPGEKTA